MGRIQARGTTRVDVTANPEGVLVAIPCYNEELAIAGIVLAARRHAARVLVIDDGSTDRTAELAELAGAVVLRNPGNKGKGYSVRRAFAYAHEQGHDALVLMDGDGQHDPNEIPLLLASLSDVEGQRVDLALGFRFGTRTQMPAWRRVGKRVLDYATAAGGAGVVTDSQCGFRAFGRRAIAELAHRLDSDGFSIETEQLVRAREAGLVFANVPIHCRYDGLDGSTKGPVQHALGVLMGIIEMVTTKRPLVFVGVPSMLLLVASVALGIQTLQMYNATRVLSIPWALLSATAAILGTFGALSALILNLLATFERRLERTLGQLGR